MPSLEQAARQPTYSPQSSETGYYPEEFSDEELAKLEIAAKKLLGENEWIVPLIPKLLIEKSVDWFAYHLIDELISKNKNTDLEEFKKIASEHLITYNLKGAKQFKEALEKSCLAILKKRFPDIKNVSDAGLNFVAIHVTSSSGKKTFSKKNIFDVWPASLLKGKILISLDDIGDRGVTQKSIKEQALIDGAKEVITVNMVEKDVPKDVEEEKRKIASPDIALLRVAFMYLLGWGLDDGVREETRELETIVALADKQPAPETIAFSANGKI